MVKTAPAALARLNAPLFRLRAGTPVRRLALTQLIQIAFALYERREYQAMRGFFSEDAVYDASGLGERLPLDMEAVSRGRDGLVQVLSAVKELTFQFTPSEIADPGGPAFAARVDTRMIGQGTATGLEMGLDLGHVYRIRGGLVARQHSYIGWDSALGVLTAARDGQPPWGDDPDGERC
jgi:hypothetical protein